MSNQELTQLETQIKLSPLAKDRLVVVETIYYQPVEANPITLLGDTSRYSRELLSSEQPYERHKVAKENWEKLDKGWINNCGLFILRNDEGKFSYNPTPVQILEASGRIIEISFNDSTPSILVPPGETCRFYPFDDKIWIRSQKITARYTLCLIQE